VRGDRVFFPCVCWFLRIVSGMSVGKIVGELCLLINNSADSIHPTNPIMLADLVNDYIVLK
jgi:hypothetical protein